MTSDTRDRQIDQAIAHLKKTDKKLAPVIKRVGRLDYINRRIGFDALVKIIIGQQLSGTVANAIYRKLCRTACCRTATVKALRQLEDAALRAAGLSNAKTRAVRDLIDKIDSGKLNIRAFRRMSDEQVAEAITQVKGMGPWSAQMYLMFTLGRLDVFAGGDLGIQKAICKLYGVNRSKTDFETFGDRWRPYRTIACWYLWASLDNR
ncbi:MAG: DNA-3-methyladenine glycosylase 2 family protein [Candidatus Zixiibacteriota bacterium]